MTALYQKRHYFDMAKFIAEAAQFQDQDETEYLTNRFVSHFKADNYQFTPSQFKQEVQLQRFMLQNPDLNREQARLKLAKLIKEIDA